MKTPGFPALALLWRALLTALVCTSAASASSGEDEAASIQDATTLSAVEVVGQAETGIGWHAGSTAGAKTALPVRELPQSVRVITAQTIEDLDATRLDDVFDYVSGIVRNNNLGNLRDGILIRGLPTGAGNLGADALLNGFSSARGYPLPRDLAGVERVEFLKGPSAALYGSSSPGGTVNIVSKRPLWEAAHWAAVSYGRDDFRRVSADTSAPLGESFAYRLNLAVEQGGSFREQVNPRRRVLAPALTWNPGESTRIDYVGEIARHYTPMDRGIVAVNGQLGVIPVSRFLGEPADGNIQMHNDTHQLLLNQTLKTDWEARFAISRRETAMKGMVTTPSALRANGDLTRNRSTFDDQSEDTAVQVEVQGIFVAAGLEHELLLGAEKYRFETDTRSLLATEPASHIINIYNPVYGQGSSTFRPWRSSAERQRNTALYAQDVLKLSQHWRLIAGLRADRYQQRVHNRVSNAVVSQSTSAISPRLGVSWLPSAQWTLYASAGKSFLPNAGVDFEGRSFKPETGRSLESGLKWESVQRDLGMSLALFDLRKRNVLTANPNQPMFSIATGEVRSRGLEWDISGQIAQNVRLNASASYTDPTIHRDNTLAVGSLVTNAARISASTLAIYENTRSNGQRYSIGAGVVHMGRRLGQARRQADVAAGNAAFYLPAWTTAKLIATWQLNPALRLSVDVDNVFDKTWYASSFNQIWVMPGAPRTVTVGLQARF